MKIIKHVFYKILLFTLILLATFKGQQGCENTALFLLWLSIIISLLSIRDDVRQQAIDANDQSPIPPIAALTINAIILAPLVYFGWWITAIGWTLAIIWNEGTRVAIEKGIAEKSKTHPLTKLNTTPTLRVPTYYKEEEK
ncbi:hypothetical protein HZU75_04370 [Chitinibacter fontanus]|uniref:Uncharacterized protein n=1 Tax=Chitinibacter fontanus TaxID=1737446 RepID=A0A7D5ZB89_9NEIS|nr:hypothetical protein [Chitinibacter fontanus]QLI80826.1 hypothetical protein HZU75_04370 [Chitinibacter fontanus]